MNRGADRNGFRHLVDDRVDEGVFRVDRAVYTDEAVFEAEIERIFEGGWVFLCHESQVERPGDYWSTEIGRQPVFVMRQRDGSLSCFLNVCSHRGAVLTPLKRGNANVLTCRFHGWVYDRAGHCIKIKNEELGYPVTEGARERFNLQRIGALDSYKGFVFGSLRSDVPALRDHLGAAARWIDLLADQGRDGMEVVPGCSTYAVHGNWKLQAENSVDGYHVTTLHSVFASTVAQRDARDATGGMRRTESGRIKGKVPSGTYDLGNGHMGLWALHTTPHVRPIYEARAWLEENLKPAEVDWILNRGRNLYLFPNVMLMDNPSTQIRFVKPVSPRLTEVTVYCIAPKGESDTARAARLRKFEDFYLTAGMATSDDAAALEAIQHGSLGPPSQWNDMTRGMDVMVAGPDRDARELGFEAAASCPDWEHEGMFHGFYRAWLERIENGAGGALAGQDAR
ncbi:MAG: Rieske 2Fe-2S domain-containing protein [Deltaproteobacteria bacterium]|nr:Rieske 2Fe-2S domain-containing protein [Deltaproteobacteria bacterium]